MNKTIKTFLKIALGSIIITLNFCFLHSYYNILINIYNLINYGGQEIQEIQEIQETQETQDKISLISYNIHHGYNFCKITIEQIIKELNIINCDIICLQEIHNIDQYNTIKTKLNNEYLYSHYFNGLGIYSKYNIEIIRKHIYNNLSLQFLNYNFNLYPKTAFLYSKINIKNTHFYLMNTHLSADITGHKQYNELLEMNTFLQDKIDKPVIITGDFNIKDNIPKIDKINNLSTVKLPYTYPSYFPCLQLDRIFYKKIQILKKNIIKTYNSDHFPILCEFKLT